MRFKILCPGLIIIIYVYLIASSFLLKAAAVETSILKGRVIDTEGKTVEGAQMFVYKGPDIRRPADFVSQKTDREGRFIVTLPWGKYWAVARLKKGMAYGPLMPGDKHSGEPLEIELDSSVEFVKDFRVADIREAASLNQKKTREDYIKIKGRVIDEKAMPVKEAYVFANINKVITKMPDYLSAWTDADGNYILYLPRGKYYYIGASTLFPPEANYSIYKEMVPDYDKIDFDIIIH